MENRAGWTLGAEIQVERFEFQDNCWVVSARVYLLAAAKLQVRAIAGPKANAKALSVGNGAKTSRH
jgi:hypothetical protein